MEYKGNIYAKIGGKYVKIGHSDDYDAKKYTEGDMEKCWSTLMVAQVLNKPIFFSDYIESLKKQD